MKLRFLCANHRVELANKPEKAITCWQNGFDTGQRLHEQGMWQEALPHLGCAFETSDIILTTRAAKPECAGKLLSCSTNLLADNLLKLKCIDQCKHVYLMTIERFEKEFSTGLTNPNWINQHLHYLYKNLSFVNEILVRQGKPQAVKTASNQTLH